MSRKAMNEQQLDHLIRMAWQYEDELKTESLAVQAEDALPSVDEMTMKRALARAQQMMDMAAHAEDAKRKRQSIRRWLHRCVNAAAALVLIAAIGLSAALATSENFRAEALRLLVSLDAGKGVAKITLIKPDVAAMNIPDAWTGSFFPAALPEGSKMTDCRMWSRGGNHQITYETPSGGLIVFSELHGSIVTEYSIENASLSYVEVGGDTAFVRYRDDHPTIGIDWANDVCWLALYTEGLSLEEALEIARSVVYMK